jgi:acid phosphatase class B
MREIDVAAVTKDMFNTNLFVTREFGQYLAPKFEELLRSEKENVFVFNFSNILYSDFSCPHEVFSQLIPNLKKGFDRFIFVKGLNQSKRENIEIALNEDKLAMIELDEEMNIKVIGHLPDYLNDILVRILYANEKLTAREIADETDTKISTSSSKLLSLWKMGLLDREEVINEDGKQFIYKSVQTLLK